MKKILLFTSLLCIMLTFTAEAQVSQSEFDALVALYNATNGDNWTDNSNWDITGTKDDVTSEWKGITVSNGKVVTLSLDNNNLTGTIPSAIENLTELQIIDISYNHLSGTIPESIGNLTKLIEFKASSNWLTGELPTQIQNISGLEVLWINNNQITGIPDLTDLPLEELYLSSNYLTFGDLETNSSVLWRDYYTPQAKVGDIQHLYSVMGSDVTLSVNLDGDHNTYQWYKNYAEILGATSDNYTITNFQPADEATYFCKIRNSVITYLILQSNDIVFSSSTSPTIKTHPKSLDNFCVDGTATFSIEANYAETYQWREKSPGGSWQDITDATNWTGYNTQSISAVQADVQYLDGYTYRCIVANPNGSDDSGLANFNIDSENPELTVQNFTLELDNTGNATLQISNVVLSATDNCTIDETTLSQTAFDCSNIEVPVIVDVSVTDISSNNVTKQSTITVVDNIAPVLSVQDYTLELDATGNASLLTTNVITASSDNCAIDETTLSQTVFDCSNIETPITIDVTVTDEYGNETTKQSVITVVDNMAPVLSVQDYTLQINTNGSATLKVSDVVTSATDNCTNTDITLSQTAFDCSNVGIPVTIDVTLTDESGNEVVEQVIITVEDNVSPTLNVENYILELDLTGNATLKVTDVVTGAADNCTIDTITLSQTNFDCSNIGTPVNVNVTIADISGNETTKSATITVVDNLDPVLSVQNYTLQLDTEGNATLSLNDVVTSAGDNCSLVDTTLSQTAFDCSNIGVPIAIDVTLTDESGNSVIEQITITVEDNLDPVLSVQNHTLQLDENGNATLTLENVITAAHDNCSLVDTTLSNTAFDCSNVGTPVTIDVTLTDASGNAVIEQAIITVEDNIDPEFDVNNHTLELDINGEATLLGANVATNTTDNCAVSSLALSKTNFNCSNIGTPVTIDVTLKDVNGNEITKQATITVVDNLDPILSVQNYTLQLDTDGNATLSLNDVVTSASDNCSLVDKTLSQTAFDCSNVGTPVSVDVTLTDISGNSVTELVIITVEDNVAPKFDVNDHILELDENGEATLMGADVSSNTTDNCSISSIALSKKNFDCSNIGTPEVIDVTLADVNGNETTKQSTITVVDNLDPALNVQNYTIELDATGNATLKASDIVTSATDNCTIADTTLSQTDFDCSNIGTPVSVDVTLSDESGNETTKQATITVVDNMDPVLSVQNHTLQLNADGDATLQLTNVVIDASDNCELADTTLSQTVFDCSNIGTPVIIDVTLSDESGNSVTEQVTVTIEDNLDPEIISTHKDKTITDEGNCEATLPDYRATLIATDNCDNNLVITQFPTAGTVITGQIPITLTATDYSGNKAEVTFKLYVDDVTNPELTVKDFTLQLNDQGAATLLVSDVVTRATDNCTLADTTLSKTQFDCSNIGTPTTIDATLIDAVGNETTKQVAITVEDNLSPETPVLEDIVEECSATVSAPTTTDNCAGTITATTDNPLTYEAQGEYIITWNFDDGNGNNIDVVQNVIIEDITNPTIQCRADTTINLSQEESTFVVNNNKFDPISTDDNCTVASVSNDFNNNASLKDAELPTGTTTITWTVTDNVGNINTCSFNVIVNLASGINNIISSNGIKVYPNPASDIVKIESKNQYINHIQIYDITGKLVKSYPASEHLESIDISDLTQGIYFVNIKADKTKQILKLIKK